ncbi:MAG TPA: hypothetical protein VGJ09_03635 [Bryobacteraceae bacterium]
MCSVLCAQQAPETPPLAAPPPAAQTPAAQTPAAQTPAPTTQPRAAVVQPLEPENLERMFSIGLFDWIPSSTSTALHAGSQAILPPPHELTLPGKPYRAYGLLITIPMKGSSRLEFSYTTVNVNGNIIAPTDLGLFGGTISQGEPLSTTYSLRHIKMSYNFLTYPNPPQDAKLRFKTLWEFHYLRSYPTVTATVTAPDQPLLDTESILLPAVGLGMEYVPSKHFRMEIRGSGMAVPHHSTLADAEGSAVVRLGRIEIFAGGKFLHFKSSPNSDTFIRGTLWGPDGGVRWVFK